MFEFSIAIPAHDRGENGPKWMAELLDSLEKQTFQDYEVVVSDQSKNDDIMNVCKEYDMSFFVIFLLAGLSVLRYVSHEAGNDRLRFLGGAALISLIISCYFLRFSKRKYL